MRRVPPACKTGAETRRRDHVVPARVTDPGQGVVFAEHRDVEAVVTHCCLERGIDPVCMSRRVQAGDAQLIDEEVVGEMLLEVQFGMGMDLVTGVQQLIRETIDLGADSGLQHVDIHGQLPSCVKTILPSCSPCSSRASASWYPSSGYSRSMVIANPRSTSASTSSNSW
jgi:hypothetical protein